MNDFAKCIYALVEMKVLIGYWNGYYWRRSKWQLVKSGKNIYKIISTILNYNVQFCIYVNFSKVIQSVHLVLHSVLV